MVRKKDKQEKQIERRLASKRKASLFANETSKKRKGMKRRTNKLTGTDVVRSVAVAVEIVAFALPMK